MNSDNSCSKTTQKKQRKRNQLRLFIFKREFLEVSVYLQTAFGAETHVAEVQRLEEQLNMVKLRVFRVGTQMTTV
jgi:CRISPR/Cas system-associated protein endoribonuclease Cas2